MGYTHYWYRLPILPAERWEEFLADARRLVEAARARGVRLGAPQAEMGSDPVLTGDEVALNGVGAESCEWFVIPREIASPRRLNEEGLAFSFCKTQGRPYDLVVTAILVAARHRFAEAFKVHSDGGEPEWAAGKQLCQEILGFGAEYAMDDERWLVRRPDAPAPQARPGPVVLREFPPLSGGRLRVRVVRSSAKARASVILDIREFVRGNFEGFTRRGIRITSLADARALRAALQAVEEDRLLRE